MKKFFPLLVSALIITMFFMTAAGFGSPEQAAALTNDVSVKTIATTGEAEISVAPTIARLTFGVESKADTASAAMQKNAADMEKVIKSLKKAGIPSEDIQTTGFNLHPEYNYSRPEEGTGRELIGYRVHNNVHAKVANLDKLGELVDQTVKAGATNVGGISFGLENTASYEEDVLAAAVKHARVKADYLAKAADSTVTGILKIEEIGGYGFEPYAAESARQIGLGDMAASATPIEPGQLSLKARVNVTFSMR